MKNNRFAAAIDRTFSVGAVHRIRFTDDVLGADGRVLADLIEPSTGTMFGGGACGGGRARVQFWLDANLHEARPDLRSRIGAFCDAHRNRVERVGNVQIVPGGEEIKNDIEILQRMLKIFNAFDLDRHSYVAVIGGGAVLDTVGFAAAIAHRGLRLIRLPTTTLAQADSGIGVKNGVNLFAKKNWIGTFAVPWGVVNDATLLESLPHRDYICGFSEAVKVALLKDPPLVERICRDAARIRRRDRSAALPIIRASAEHHLDHITRGGDPFEALQARPLDFGHWSAHKMEAMSEFSLRHGEAVAIGVAIDTVYSSRVLGLPESDARRVLRCLVELGFSLRHPTMHDTETLFAGLEEFRQHLGGRLTLVMLRGVGQPVEVHEVDYGEMATAIREVAEFVRSPGSGVFAPATPSG
jgi:3-dehydroquinate synthase